MRVLLSRRSMATRKLIEPEQLQIEPFEHLFRVTSPRYDFLIARKPQADLLYEHDCSTPAAVLRKPGIHVLPESVPELNRREKWSAVNRLVESAYENAYRNCTTPKDAFHLERKIRGEIRNRLFFVGCLDGRKYRHLLRFTPYAELLAENTQKEYEKKGVAVDALGGERIFPSGKVWLPTSEKYLQDYVKILAGVTGKGEMSMLDIGCGSGILSFLFARQFRKSRVCAIDKNPDAVRTCNINAARLQFRNVEAFECDVQKPSEYDHRSLEHKLPKKYDWIAVNPPWIASSKIEGESPLVEGVYDGSNMLKHSLALAKKLLSPDGRIVLIYSDLSQLLGLEKQSVEELLQEEGLLVQERHEQALAEEMVKKSAIGELKSKSKILTYVLRHS